MNESANYRRIEKVITHIDRNRERQPDLGELARVAGLSVFHFSREFRRWAGLSPARYLRTLSLSVAKQELDDRGSVLAAAWAAGLSGGGRLHDLFVQFEAVTPGEYKAGGAGLSLSHGFAHSPFGRIHAATSDRGLAYLAFVDGSDERAVADRLRTAGRGRCSKRDDADAARIARQIFVEREGRIVLAPMGTNFQVKVWRALLELGTRGATSYGALAEAHRQPRREPCGRAGGRRESGRLAHPLPSRSAWRWGPWRLPLGRRAQAGDSAWEHAVNYRGTVPFVAKPTKVTVP